MGYVGCPHNMAQFIGILIHQKPMSVELHDFMDKWATERGLERGISWRSSSEPLDLDAVTDLLSFISDQYVGGIKTFSEANSSSGFLGRKFEKAKTGLRDTATLAVRCGIGINSEGVILNFVKRVREETPFGAA